MRWSVVSLIGIGACLCAPDAHADGPLGENGSPIRTSRYSIDLTTGPVLLGARATALGGAYVAIADGTDGLDQNPVAPAVRTSYSVDPVDYDLSVGLTFPSTLQDNDFFNTGKGKTDLSNSDESEFALLTPAAIVQLGPWGIGASLNFARYGLRRLDPTGTGRSEQLVRAQISQTTFSLARAVDDGQLIAGIAFQITALDLTTNDELFTRAGNLYTTRGLSFSGGLLWRPNGRQYRLGLAVNAPVTTQINANIDPDSDIIFGTSLDDPNAFWLPLSVKRPWSASVGIAHQLGPRPLNPRWVDRNTQMRRLDAALEKRAAARDLDPTLSPAEASVQEALDEAHRNREARRLRNALLERHRSMSREYVLLTAALQANGRLRDAVGVESFIQGVVDRSGKSVTFAPRVGVETEPIAGRLKTRVGSYLEPSRFEDGSMRIHSTGGIEVKLFRWDLFGLNDPRTHWRIGGSLDVARNYFSWGLNAGVWH